MDVCFSQSIIAGIVVLLSFLYYWIKNRDVLPGPTGVPYLGLYPFLTDENIQRKLEEYKKKYGDVFSFTYSGRLYINLGSVKSMREVLVTKSDCFQEKYKDTNILSEMLRNGVTYIGGEPWKILKKFFLLKFKDYGLNTISDNMADPVYDSLNSTIKDMRLLQGKPVNIVEFLGQRCAVTMRKIVFGETGVTDEKLGKMIDSFAEVLDGNLGVNLLLIGPLARLLFATMPSFRKKMDCNKRFAKLILDCCKEVEKSMNEEQPTCIIEEFYKERNRRRKENDPTWKFFSDEALVESLVQFIGDGIQAVAALIAGILNTLVEYPDEQDKMYSELMDVIGPNRQPTAADKPKLPYTNAFMNEYLRQTSFINFFPGLECTKETRVRGYRIPVGSITLINFWSSHHDPDTFDDPDVFNPSRYMPSAGKPKAESPVAFGMGKRSCSGESFVMLQTFLFVTTIVKNFRIVGSSSPVDQSAEVLMVGKLELTFIPRSENSSSLDS